MKVFHLARPCMLIAAGGWLLGACTTVPIDPSDSTNPTVTIKVKGTDGQYHAMSDVDYGNNNVQAPIEIMAIVEDPEGVKSIDLGVSDNTVDTAYCGGSIHGGNWVVAGLPPSVGDVLSGSSGKVPTKLTAFLEISGILQLATNPPGEAGPCFPANNTKITVRCQGRNWASNPPSSTHTQYLQVHFKF